VQFGAVSGRFPDPKGGQQGIVGHAKGMQGRDPG
jgi:hypothetical protein